MRWRDHHRRLNIQQNHTQNSPAATSLKKKKKTKILSMQTGDNLGNKKARSLASIWYLDKKHGKEDRMLPLETISSGVYQPKKRWEEKQVEMNKSRCFPRAVPHETEARKATASTIIKQLCTPDKGKQKYPGSITPQTQKQMHPERAMFWGRSKHAGRTRQERKNPLAAPVPG